MGQRGGREPGWGSRRLAQKCPLCPPAWGALQGASGLVCRVSGTSRPGDHVRFVPGVEALGAPHADRLRKRLGTAPHTLPGLHHALRALPPQVPAGLSPSVSGVGTPSSGPEARVAVAQLPLLTPRIALGGLRSAGAGEASRSLCAPGPDRTQGPLLSSPAPAQTPPKVTWSRVGLAWGRGAEAPWGPAAAP